MEEKLNNLLDRVALLEDTVRVPEVVFRVLHSDFTYPAYKTAGAVGMDLSVCGYGGHPMHPGETRIFSTGLAIELPPGYEAQIRSRSGLAAKGIVVANSPGTIDWDFLGEIKVILRNDSAALFDVCHGDRIAQIVIARVVRPMISVSTKPSVRESGRGTGGFGSTGK